MLFKLIVQVCCLWLVFGCAFQVDCLLLSYFETAVLAVAFMSEAFELRQTDTTQTTAPNPEPAWLDQLPPHLGRDLLLLQAQDHYVRAETALGDTLIRAQLQDVAEELGSYGVRLHRSWWVARRARGCETGG